MNKRIFDIIIASAALIMLFIPCIFIYLLIAIRLGFPVIFIQKRPGKNGNIFRMYKFRTMSNDCDSNGNLLPKERRLGSFGNKLRSTSIDELPELINVLKGDMSIVGPRPLREEYLPLYSSEQARRHEVKPGVTGWAQIHGRNAISWDEKFKLDIWYVDNQSFLLDLKIIILTIWKVINRDGINQSDVTTMEPFKGAKLDG